MLTIIGISWIDPIWPKEQAMHSSLTAVGLITLFFFNKKFPLKTTDFLLIAIFVILHSIAARWLYSMTPYDQWCRSAFGFSIQQTFSWERNHFDRLIHFAYGLCFTPALCSWLIEYREKKPLRAFLISLNIIMISSLVYEWFEWLIAILLSPEAAESYNGQQGDMWDAHMDMLLATLGSCIFFLPYWLRSRRQACS